MSLGIAYNARHILQHNPVQATRLSSLVFVSDGAKEERGKKNKEGAKIAPGIVSQISVHVQPPGHHLVLTFHAHHSTHHHTTATTHSTSRRARASHTLALPGA